MMARFPHALAAVLAGLIALSSSVRPASIPQDEDLDAFVLAIQASLQNADPGAYRALLLAQDEATAQRLAEETHVRGATRVTVKERDRQHLTGALPGEGYRLMLEVFTERGARGQIVAWRVDVRLARLGSSDPTTRAWRIVDQERGSTLDGLYRLALDPTRQYVVRDFEMDSIDFHLKVASGEAFAAETDEGITTLVVRGRGQMRFSPPDEAERTQLRLFSGSESIVAPFDEVYLRVSPAHLARLVKVDSLRASPVDPRALKRAQEVFARHVRQSYSLNLSDLSAETWSLAPSGEDCIVEVRTRKLGTLTYARAMNEAEDISLFDRASRRNISVYASAAKLKARGRFYNEDDLNEYDVLDYYVNATFTPVREWIEGEATLRLRVTEPALTTVTLRLDEDLVVRSVSMPGVGRLMHLRVIGQNNLIVNLPTIVPRDT
ncbi:MAG TPA: hypothetical protein VJ787_06795, partial [Thermoleophilia bacterium]|nr:hypothetical protein [Thermoleophilia bacterium]